MALPMDIPEDRTLWCRYEMKYLLEESHAAAVESHIRPHLKLDRYSLVAPGGAYPIVSLYLDSPELKLFRESMDGKATRFKLRIRAYSDEPAAPCFMEIKRRIHAVILKSRARATKESLAALLAGAPHARLGLQTDAEALAQFQLYALAIAARPVARVRYLRTAYEDDTFNRVRVTFDRRICCNPSQALTVGLNGSGWLDLGLRKVLLEIKFTGRYPGWIERMVRAFGLRAQGVSKYGLSVKRSCLAGFRAPRAMA